MKIFLFCGLFSIGIALSRGRDVGDEGFYDSIGDDTPIYFPRQVKETLRKSEEACKKFGPSYHQKAFTSIYVQPEEYLHNVALGKEQDDPKEIIWGYCTGVLIDKYYVLTVAHCVLSPDVKLPVMIRAGNIDLSGAEDKELPQDVAVDKITVHPNYSRVKRTDDIALIRLKEPVKLGKYVQPACLYTKSDEPLSMISTGWGRLELTSGAYSDFLLKSNVRLVDKDACKRIYDGKRTKIQDTQICGYSDTELCHLGSGAPIFVTNSTEGRVKIVGLTTFGKGCGSTFPTVHTKVYSYLDWIESIVWS